MTTNADIPDKVAGIVKDLAALGVLGVPGISYVEKSEWEELFRREVL